MCPLMPDGGGGGAATAHQNPPVAGNPGRTPLHHREGWRQGHSAAQPGSPSTQEAADAGAPADGSKGTQLDTHGLCVLGSLELIATVGRNFISTGYGTTPRGRHDPGGLRPSAGESGPATKRTGHLVPGAIVAWPSAFRAI